MPDRVIALVGLALLAAGLAIGLPPVGLLGPGAALAVPGGLLIAYAVLPDQTAPAGPVADDG